MKRENLGDDHYANWVGVVAGFLAGVASLPILPYLDYRIRGLLMAVVMHFVRYHVRAERKRDAALEESDGSEPMPVNEAVSHEPEIPAAVTEVPVADAPVLPTRPVAGPVESFGHYFWRRQRLHEYGPEDGIAFVVIYALVFVAVGAISYWLDSGIVPVMIVTGIGGQVGWKLWCYSGMLLRYDAVLEQSPRDSGQTGHRIRKEDDSSSSKSNPLE